MRLEMKTSNQKGTNRKFINSNANENQPVK